MFSPMKPQHPQLKWPRHSIRVFRLGVFGFSVSVFCQGFPFGVFVWALRQRLLSGFSVWGVCLGSPSVFSVRVFRLECLSGLSVSVFCQSFPFGVFVWALRQCFLSGLSVWGVCLGSPSVFSVRVFRLGCLFGFSVSVYCHGFPSGWVGPRFGLDRCEKFLPPPGFHHRTFQPVASRYTVYATRPTSFVELSINWTKGPGRSG
jgi:hypothetical protein